MNVIAKGDASPRVAGVVALDYGFRDGDGYAEPEQPYVCPGCYAVGGEACAADCIDLAIEQEAEDDAGDDDACVFDDCTECDCSRCEGARSRWERLQGGDASPGAPGDEDDGEIPF